MNLSDEMKVSARSIGLCDQWFGEWKDDTSKDELIEKLGEYNIDNNSICKDGFLTKFIIK